MRYRRLPVLIIATQLLAIQPVIAALCGGQVSKAAERFLLQPVLELDVEGPLPTATTDRWSRWVDFGWRADFQPSVDLDGGGEAYFTIASDGTPAVAARVEHDDDVTGWLCLPNEKNDALVMVRFRMNASRADATHAHAFHNAKEARYRDLLRSGAPGAAWFRLRLREAEAALSALADPTAEQPRGLDPVDFAGRPPRDDDMDETFALFSGARAIAENLQLDRDLRVDPAGDDERVAIDTLKSIDIRPYDFAARLHGDPPVLDALASSIPADQHAAFFPSFAALVAVIDEADAEGTPLLHLLEEAADAGTRTRYERQLCLELNALTRALGPLAIDSVAITGSDPYLRSGADVAVLFEAREPALLLAWLQEAHAAACRRDAAIRPFSGSVDGIAYQAARDPERGVSSYVMAQGQVVLVTNSMVQLQAFADVMGGRRAALASSDEYRFFRQRYPHTDAAESGLIVLTDATIRRWCGPRWRIGASRRVRAAAKLAHAQAERLAAHADGDTVSAAHPTADISAYGNLRFLTPIAELDLTDATRAEADAYLRFRNTYQQNFDRFFDPIAISLRVDTEVLAADVSVLPLIDNTEYRDLRAFVGGVSLAPADADPHPEALLQLLIALNRQSDGMREAASWFDEMGQGIVNPLGWVGNHIGVFVDDDPVFDEISADGEWFDEFSEQLNRLPVALVIAIRDPVAAAAFLTALRAFAQETVPGMLAYQTVHHGEQAYVRVRDQGSLLGNDEHLSIFYAVTRDRLIVTLHEELLKRWLDRRAASDAAVEPPALLGESFAGSMGGRTTRALRLLAGRGYDYTAQLRRRSWRNLTILDEWQRLFPEQDPVAVHERAFAVRLVCPGGGQYVWNEATRCMESTVFGSPRAPRMAQVAQPIFERYEQADFGVTFEEDGLRGRVMLSR